MTSDHQQRNLAIKYQFQVDGLAAAPPRDSWEEAAEDAIAAGFAEWVNSVELKIDSPGWIQRIRPPT